MICACFCVVHIAFIIFADFCLFLKSKNICKKHFGITCFLLLFRNKNKPVCFAKSTEWDIYKVKNNSDIIDL